MRRSVGTRILLGVSLAGLLHTGVGPSVYASAPAEAVARLVAEGRTIGVELPNFVELRVTFTEPGVKGDTATGATKPATVETGAIVSVPLFVNQGDMLKIDTRTCEYVERA